MLERKDNLYHDIKTLLENARKKVLSTVNSTMTLTYFLISRRGTKWRVKSRIWKRAY